MKRMIKNKIHSRVQNTNSFIISKPEKTKDPASSRKQGLEKIMIIKCYQASTLFTVLMMRAAIL